MATFSTSGFAVSALINAQDVIYVQGGEDEHDPERKNTRDVGERKKE